MASNWHFFLYFKARDKVFCSNFFMTLTFFQAHFLLDKCPTVFFVRLSKLMKGIVSRDEYFLEVLKFETVLYE